MLAIRALATICVWPMGLLQPWAPSHFRTSRIALETLILIGSEDASIDPGHRHHAPAFRRRCTKARSLSRKLASIAGMSSWSGSASW